MCLCYCWMVVLVWESQCRLENDCFQCGTFPHYSLPLSFQSGPALLQLAAQIFIFVYILHGHTNSKVLSVWCFTSSFKPLCLLNAIFQLDCGLKQVVGQELPNTYVFRSFPFFFFFFSLFHPLSWLPIDLYQETLCVFTLVHNERFLPSTCWWGCSLS